MADQQQAPGLLANILAVAGFILLIVIIVWGAYHLLRLTGSGVSSLFSRFGGESGIVVTVPQAAIESGRVFPVSWTYETETAGAYAFLYRCTTGFRFNLPTSSGAAGTAIPCGSAFSVGDAKSLNLVPTISGTTSVDVPLTIVFMPSATSTDERPQGTATVRVVSAGTNGTQQPGTSNMPSTSTPSIPTTQTPSTAVVAGTPDLSVRILGFGVIDMSGMFVMRAPMHAGEIAAVKFDIANNGSASSGSYHFNVQLPMQGQGGYTYASPVQASLAPGAHVENTLRFRPMQPGGGTITVAVDSAGAVRESNEGNNNASIWANAQMYPYENFAPYVY